MSEATRQMLRVEDTKAGRTVPRWKFIVLAFWIPIVVTSAMVIPKSDDLFLLLVMAFLFAQAITLPLTAFLSPHLRRFIS